MKKLEQIRQESIEIKEKIYDTEERLRQEKNQKKNNIRKPYRKCRRTNRRRNKNPTRRSNKDKRIQRNTKNNERILRKTKATYQEYESKKIFKESFYKNNQKEIDQHIRSRTLIEKISGKKNLREKNG